MDNFSNNNSEDSDDIIRFDEVENQEPEPIPFDDSEIKLPESKPGISHSPLSLGKSGLSSPSPMPGAAVKKTTGKAKPASSADRISGIKTFFAKLHIGSIGYVDEQINDWLTDNPGVSIKMTNVTVGNVISKTNEPNLIVNIWY